MLVLLLKKLGECILLDPVSSIGEMMYRLLLNKKGYNGPKDHTDEADFPLLSQVEVSSSTCKDTPGNRHRLLSWYAATTPVIIAHFPSGARIHTVPHLDRIVSLASSPELFVDIDDISGLLPAASM